MFAIVKAIQTGKQKGDPSKGPATGMAKSMKKKDVEDFASTKTKGLPKKVKRENIEPLTDKENWFHSPFSNPQDPEKVDVIAKQLKERILRILKEGSRSYFSKEDAKKIVADLSKITKIKFPNKRLTGHGRTEYKVGEINLVVSFDQGIIIFENWDGPLPNVNQLKKYFEKHFGDVSFQQGGSYINARDFGLASIPDKIIMPKKVVKIPSIFLPDPIKSEKEALKIIKIIRQIANGRKVKTEGKPRFKVQQKIDVNYKIVSHNKDWFLTDGMTMYYIKSKTEGGDLFHLLDYYHKLMRKLEVASWSSQDFSNPNG